MHGSSAGVRFDPGGVGELLHQRQAAAAEGSGVDWSGLPVTVVGDADLYPVGARKVVGVQIDCAGGVG